MVVRIAAGFVRHVDLERAVGSEADLDRRVGLGVGLIAEMPVGI
jgi:hypothetical protein